MFLSVKANIGWRFRKTSATMLSALMEVGQSLSLRSGGMSCPRQRSTRCIGTSIWRGWSRVNAATLELSLLLRSIPPPAERPRIARVLACCYSDCGSIKWPSCPWSPSSQLDSSGGGLRPAGDSATSTVGTAPHLSDLAPLSAISAATLGLIVGAPHAHPSPAVAGFLGVTGIIATASILVTFCAGLFSIGGQRVALLSFCFVMFLIFMFNAAGHFG